MLRRPEGLEVGEYGRELLISQSVVEWWHGQLRSLIEWVTQAAADDVRKLSVGVAPGVAAVVMGWSRQVAAVVRLLPVRGTFGVLAMAVRAVPQVEVSTQADLGWIEFRQRDLRRGERRRTAQQLATAPGQDRQTSCRSDEPSSHSTA